MRSRSEVLAERQRMAAASAEKAKEPEDDFPDSYKKPTETSPKVEPRPRHAIEDNFSEMLIGIKNRGLVVGGLSVVAGWTPSQRHVVAMWLLGQLAGDDVPECVSAAASRVKELEARDPSYVAPEKQSSPKSAPDPVTREEEHKILAKAESLIAKSKATPSPAARPAREGETVSVTSNSFKFSTNYSSFEVPSFTVTLKASDGDDHGALFAYARELLSKQVAEAREEAKREFFVMLKGVAAEAKK